MTSRMTWLQLWAAGCMPLLAQRQAQLEARIHAVCLPVSLASQFSVWQLQEFIINLAAQHPASLEEVVVSVGPHLQAVADYATAHHTTLEKAWTERWEQ